MREWSAENIREEGQEHCQLREEEAECQACKNSPTPSGLLCTTPTRQGWGVGAGRREPRSQPPASSQPPTTARPRGPQKSGAK